MSDEPTDSLRRELEAAALNESHRHEPDHERGGCTCGFCAYSVEHVVIMSVREGARRSVSAALEAARADERANGLAEAAAIVEGLGQKFDAASDVLWEAAENAGWKVLPLAVSDGD